MKYEIYGTHCGKVINKFKVFKKKVKSQGKKYDSTHGKVLSLEILMWNIKALALMVERLLGRLTFRAELQNDRLVNNNMPANVSAVFPVDVSERETVINSQGIWPCDRYICLFTNTYCLKYKLKKIYLNHKTILSDVTSVGPILWISIILHNVTITYSDK